MPERHTEFDVPGLRTEYHGGPIMMDKDDVRVEETDDGVALHYGIAFTDDNGETDVGSVTVYFDEVDERIEIHSPAGGCQN